MNAVFISPVPVCLSDDGSGDVFLFIFVVYTSLQVDQGKNHIVIAIVVFRSDSCTQHGSALPPQRGDQPGTRGTVS